METEGTYPYSGGGVSTWCDILIHELSAIDYYIFAISGSPSYQLKYKLPENVKRIQQIPLWATVEPSEHILPEVNFSDVYLKRKQTSDSIITENFVPLLKILIYVKKFFANLDYYYYSAY